MQERGIKARFCHSRSILSVVEAQIIFNLPVMLILHIFIYSEPQDTLSKAKHTENHTSRGLRDEKRDKRHLRL